MLVHHFTNTKFGLKVIREKRLKVSDALTLNDPFEFFSPETPDQTYRDLLTQFKNGFFKDRGLLCFSRNWQNPVQWSHYADRHRGLCLGFEVPSDLLMQVNYVSSRSPWPQHHWPWDDDVGKAFITKLLTTKFSHWSYEDEYRLFTTKTEDASDGLAYVDFSEQIRLVEITIGMRSELKLDREKLREALETFAQPVNVFIAGESSRDFEVVRTLETGQAPV